MGHLLKLKCAHSPLNLSILSSTSVPFTLLTVPAPNLLPQTKRITVYMLFSINLLLGDKTHILYDLSRPICWFKQDRFLVASHPPPPPPPSRRHSCTSGRKTPNRLVFVQVLLMGLYLSGPSDYGIDSQML
jgi:hypothetical protein